MDACSCLRRFSGHRVLHFLFWHLHCFLSPLSLELPEVTLAFPLPWEADFHEDFQIQIPSAVAREEHPKHIWNHVAPCGGDLTLAKNLC